MLIKLIGADIIVIVLPISIHQQYRHLSANTKIPPQEYFCIYQPNLTDLLAILADSRVVQGAALTAAGALGSAPGAPLR